MRRRSTILAIVVVIAVGAIAVAVAFTTGSSSQSERRGAIGTRLPDFALPGIDGGTVSAADHRGAPLVVAFGASWCAPCKLEYPMLAAAKAAHPDLRIIGVLEQDVPALMVKFMRSVGADWRVGNDADGSVGDRFGVRGLPVTLFVDRSGIIVGRRAGLADQATLDRELAKIGI